MVKVGAATETEMKEKKHRVEDALQATRAALEEGIVPGGGIALLAATKAVKVDAIEIDDERTGARIVLRALEEPLRQIAENSGLEGSVVVNDVRKAKTGQGLNAATGEIEDLVAAGVIDPAMVTRSALQNAASIAKNILTTEAIVAEMPEKDGGGMPRRRNAGHGRDDVGKRFRGSGSQLAFEGPAFAPGPLSSGTDAHAGDDVAQRARLGAHRLAGVPLHGVDDARARPVCAGDDAEVVGAVTAAGPSVDHEVTAPHPPHGDRVQPAPPGPRVGEDALGKEEGAAQVDPGLEERLVDERAAPRPAGRQVPAGVSLPALDPAPAVRRAQLVHADLAHGPANGPLARRHRGGR